MSEAGEEVEGRFPAFLTWVPQEDEPETEVQALYLGGDPRNHKK